MYFYLLNLATQCRGIIKSCRCASKPWPVQKREEVKEPRSQRQRRTSKAITEVEDQEAGTRDGKPRPPEEKSAGGGSSRREVLSTYLMEKAIVLSWLLTDLLGQRWGGDTRRQEGNRVVLLRDQFIQRHNQYLSIGIGRC